MRWLIAALSSSLGKKFVMGATGLLLCVFLVFHLAGNLLLYIGETEYNRYAEALHMNEGLLMVAEALLALLFIGHITLAVKTTLDNRAARRLRYETKNSKIDDRQLAPLISPENWMFISGAIVLGFLLLHLVDFTFELRTDLVTSTEGEHLTPFEKAVRILSNPISAVVYLVGSLILGIHLGHGVHSAFRSLGLNDPRFDPLIKWSGVAFGVIIGLGFASFVVWAFLPETAR